MSIEKTEAKSTDLLRQVAKNHGFGMEELAHIALIPRSTFMRRLARPSAFTVGELRDVFDALSLDADEALGIVAELFWEGDD